jgi:hypothetical protein
MEKSPWFLRQTVVGTRRIVSRWWNGAGGNPREFGRGGGREDDLTRAHRVFLDYTAGRRRSSS